MKRILLLMGVFVLLSGTGYGQVSGDIAFVGFNADGDDDFAIVVLADLPANTSIYFTDNEPSADGTGLLDTNEGTVLWETGGSVITAGTIVTFTDTDAASNGSFGASVGTLSYVETSMNFAAGGDAVYATLGDPTTGAVTEWLAGMQNESGNEGANFSATGLVDGQTFFDMSGGSGNPDGGAYNRSTTTGTQAELLAAIYNSSNWTIDASNGENLLPFTTTSLTVNAETVSITGDAGWRLLSLPKKGGTIEDVSDDSPVQGVTGGSDTGADANFIIYDSDATFEQPTNVSTAWGDGLGFGLYFYNNTTNGSSALPLSLDSRGGEPTSNVEVTLNPAASGYTLVGNPFASNLDASSLTATSSNISNNIAFWNDGTGSYSTQDRTTPYIVSTWQGFWVQTVSASATTLTIPTSGKTSSAATGSFFSKTVNNRGDISFTLSSETTFDEDIRMAFREQATFGYDADDFGKLTPLLTSYATMAFASNDMLKSVESLPYDLDREVTIELQPQLVGVSGEFTFDWSGLESIPAEWELTLHDYEMDASVNMRDVSEYVFTAGAQAKANPNPLSLLTGPAAVAMKAKTEGNRFGITIRPTSVSSELDETPLGFGLAQNYPNPFNPSTTISYTIENAGAVNLSVYNLMGQRVATLVNEAKSAGTHSVRWNAAGAASGMYYYRLESNGQSVTRKMTLIK